jgi:hypothetical protein
MFGLYKKDFENLGIVLYSIIMFSENCVSENGEKEKKVL